MTEPAQSFDQATSDLATLESQLNSVIIGQESLVRECVIAVFARGHVLIEGLPGLGKTNLAKAIAALLDLSAGRVQCTPDLLPSDITGSEVLLNDAQAAANFEFREGPVFANLVLVDEIDRGGAYLFRQYDIARDRTNFIHATNRVSRPQVVRRLSVERRIKYGTKALRGWIADLQLYHEAVQLCFR